METLRDAVLHPTDPDRITLLYTNGRGGLIDSNDGGASWRLICNDLLGVSREADAAAMDGRGRVHLGFLGAMFVDDGTRCAFEAALPFDGEWVRSLVTHPADPSVVFVTTSRGSEDNGIWRRDGDGEFVALGTREQVLIGSLGLAALPAGGERYYETISRGETMELIDGRPEYFANYFVRSSDDGALSWTEHAFEKTLGTLRLELVDPTDPLRLVVSVDNSRVDVPDEVLVSDDGGASFRRVAEVAELGGVTRSTDGRLWVGDAKGGLYAGALNGEPLALVTDALRPTCVRFEPLRGRLYVCESFAFGFYDDATDRYTELLDSTKVEDFVACSGVSALAAVCEDQMFFGYCGPTHFPDAAICWQNYPDRVPPPDRATGGSGDSGAGMDAGDVADAGGDAARKATGAGGGGCSAVGAGGAPSATVAVGAWVLAVALLGLRAARRTRPRQTRVSTRSAGARARGVTRLWAVLLVVSGCAREAGPDPSSAGAGGGFSPLPDAGVAPNDSLDGDAGPADAALPDPTDACPNDAAKTAVGACGCGVADTDRDGDGAADCVDACPDDAIKTAAGACGCGVADEDADADGVADCAEARDESLCVPGAPDGACDCTGKVVHFVYFVEADEAFMESQRADIEAQAYAFQQYWYEQLGVTFFLSEPVVDVIEADHDADWYVTTPDGIHGDSRWYRLGNIKNEVYAKLGIGNFDDAHRVVNYPTSRHDGRVGGNFGGAWMDGDDLTCMAGDNGGVNYPYADGAAAHCMGHVAHEFGHVLGLDHEGPSTDCMQYGFYNNSGGSGMCSFAPANVAKILADSDNADWFEATPGQRCAP